MGKLGVFSVEVEGRFAQSGHCDVFFSMGVVTSSLRTLRKPGGAASSLPVAVAEDGDPPICHSFILKGSMESKSPKFHLW